MKRGKVNKNDAKSYRFEPSDVYEVTYIKAKHHEIGDKDYVSLPVAIMFINEGKITSTSEIEEAIAKYGMSGLIKSKNKNSKSCL